MSMNSRCDAYVNYTVKDAFSVVRLPLCIKFTSEKMFQLVRDREANDTDTNSCALRCIKLSSHQDCLVLSAL